MKNKILAILLSLSLLACSEDFLNLKNPNANDSGTFFTNGKTLTQSVNSIYQVMNNEPMMARKWFFLFDLLSNEGTTTINGGSEFQQLSFAVYDATNPCFIGVWQGMYKMAMRSIFALDKLKEWNPVKPDEIALKTRLQGEAEYFLGFAYYHLAVLWGDVPLRKTMEDITVNVDIARAKQAEVLEFAAQNLLSATEKLPAKYGDSKDNGRATLYAAKAFLGRVYSYQGKYAEALPLFKDIVDNGGFQMWQGVQGFEKQFRKENRFSSETIFDVKFMHYAEGNEWFIFWGGDEAVNAKGTTSARAQEYSFAGGWWNVTLPLSAVSNFKYAMPNNAEYIDPRAFYTFYGDGGFGGDMDYLNELNPTPTPYDFTKKWNYKKYQEDEYKLQQSPNSEISMNMVRLADMNLMVAECYIMTGNIQAALPYINAVRTRVEAITYTGLPNAQEDAMKILERERNIELMGEQLRWFDLCRWNKNRSGFNMVGLLNAERIASGLGARANMQEKHILFPIPQAEKDVNKLCEVPNGWN